MGFANVSEGVEGIELGSWGRRAGREYGAESPGGSGRELKVAGFVQLRGAHCGSFWKQGRVGNARPNPQDKETDNLINQQKLQQVESESAHGVSRIGVPARSTDPGAE
jgi:hypothetical protein